MADNLFTSLERCLAEPDPREKCQAVEALARVAARNDTHDRADEGRPVRLFHAPGRPERPELVPPAQLPKRGLNTEAGRAALVHAVAHIEFNAINLALDAAYRFRDMPDEFVRDWISVAQDESRHFAMLSSRLASMGHAYGDFPAHNGLWEMAQKTAHSCLARMALVPRVLEARGLDVTPPMISRLRDAGDAETVEVLEIILEEEVRHVAIGTRWFRHCCAREGREPVSTFLELVGEYFGAPRGPFNVDARLTAGFTREELSALARQVA